jgi:16S rRNA (adenine1518-N6/adenine1519-N6)-dimethyltransferase
MNQTFRFEAKKSLGQHFLANTHYVKRIIEACGINSASKVLEIGPGCGALTKELLKLTDNLVAVEFDSAACRFLKENFPNLNLINGDFLQYDLSAYDNLTIVGNLPYNISAKILAHCTKYIKQISAAVFMFQKEVAVRICAADGKEYSSLSVFAQYHYNIEKLFDIGGGNFWPKAKVTSTVLRLIPKKPAHKDTELFLEFVRKAFAQKRKILSNTLKEEKQLSEALKRLNIPLKIRAEELSIEDFIRLYNVLREVKNNGD